MGHVLMLTSDLRAHINNPFIVRKKLKYTFNRVRILIHGIILSIHSMHMLSFSEQNIVHRLIVVACSMD